MTLLVGGVAAALAGLLVAVPSFRTRGDYLAIITLAVNYIVKSSIENIQAIGGARGFMGMRNVINAMNEVVESALGDDLDPGRRGSDAFGSFTASSIRPTARASWPFATTRSPPKS